MNSTQLNMLWGEKQITECLILPHQAPRETKRGLSTLRKPRTSSEALQLNTGLPGCLLGPNTGLSHSGPLGLQL